MPIITISRGSYSRGKEVAERVAERLGYDCVGRDVLIEASREFNVEEVKLTRAIRDAPSFLERLSYGKERYIAYIRSALLGRLKHDNVVYHGLAGHVFVRDIGHVLKVRIIADLEDRVEQVMKRDGVSRKEALRFIDRVDRERRRWSQKMYGIDPADPALYDLVVHIRELRVEDAVEVICHTAGLPRFQATEASRRELEDAALAAAVKAALVERYPECEVTARDGRVQVLAKGSEAEALGRAGRIERIAEGVPGVREVEVRFRSYTPFAI